MKIVFCSIFYFTCIVAKSQSLTGKDIYQLAKQGNNCINIAINGNSNIVNIYKESRTTKELLKFTKINNALLKNLLFKINNSRTTSDLVSSYEKLSESLMEASGNTTTTADSLALKKQADFYLKRAVVLKCNKDNTKIYSSDNNHFYITDSFVKGEFEIFESDEEYRCYRYNNGYGYIDRNNKIVLDPVLDYAQNFSKGLAFAQENGKDFFIAQDFSDSTYHIQFNFETLYEIKKVSPFYGKNSIVEYSDGFQFFMSIYGKSLDLDFENIIPSAKEDIFFVQKNMVITDTAILKKNRIQFPDTAMISKCWGLIYNDGEHYKWLIEPSFVFIQNISSNLFLALGYQKCLSYPFDSTVNTQKNSVVKPNSDLKMDKQEKLDYSIIDYNGNIVVTFDGTVGRFSEGLATLTKDDGTCFNVDTSGNALNTNRFNKCYDFKNGLAIVIRNKKYGLMNKFGTYIFEPVYSNIRYLDENIYEIQNGIKKQVYSTGLFNKKMSSYSGVR